MLNVPFNVGWDKIKECNQTLNCKNKPLKIIFEGNFYFGSYRVLKVDGNDSIRITRGVYMKSLI